MVGGPAGKGVGGGVGVAVGGGVGVGGCSVPVGTSGESRGDSRAGFNGDSRGAPVPYPPGVAVGVELGVGMAVGVLRGSSGTSWGPAVGEPCPSSADSPHAERKAASAAVPAPCKNRRLLIGFLFFNMSPL